MPRGNGAVLETPLALAAGVFGVGAVLAVALQGLAGDEEAAHYLIARYAPAQPELFLNLTGRPLVTLALTLPSQLGPLGARLMGALATAAAAYAVARGALRGGWTPPAIAVLFFLLQPFLLAHTATAMTEPFTAALVAFTILAYGERRWILFALCAGLLPPARFELLVLLPVAALVLARERAWATLGVLFAPVFLWNAIGAMVDGDPLYLLHLADPSPYPKREVLHYAKSLVWVVGLGLFTPLVAGIVLSVKAFVARRKPGKKKREDDAGQRLLVGSAVVVFLFLALYSYVAALRPITLGNLRYLAFLAAPVAWMASAGTHAIAGPRSRWVAASLGISLLGALLFWNHPIRDDYEITKNFTFYPALAGLAWIALYALPKRPAWIAFLLVSALSLATLLTRGPTLHVAPLPEEKAMAEATSVVEGFPIGEVPVHRSHPLLSFHLGGNHYDGRVYPSPSADLPTTSSPGTFWFWDSHYTGREGTYFEIGYLLDQAGWRYLGGGAASDSSFAAGWLVKGTGPLPEGVTVHPSMSEEAWTTIAVYSELRIASSLGAVRKDPRSDLRWRELRFKLNQLSLMGRAEEALRFLDTEAPQSNKADDRAIRAVFLERLGRYDEALAEAQKARELDPKNPFNVFLVAQSAWSLGDKERAGPVLLKAVEAMPKNGDVQFMAGEVFRERRDWQSADAKFVEASRLLPMSSKTFLRAGESAWRLENPKGAETRFREAIRLSPKEASGYLLLGDFYRSQKRPEDALMTWRAGLSRTGNDSLAARVQEFEEP